MGEHHAGRHHRAGGKRRDAAGAEPHGPSIPGPAAEGLRQLVLRGCLAQAGDKRLDGPGMKLPAPTCFHVSLQLLCSMCKPLNPNTPVLVIAIASWNGKVWSHDHPASEAGGVGVSECLKPCVVPAMGWVAFGWEALQERLILCYIVDRQCFPALRS